MIEGITGLPGGGKTLYAVRRLLEAKNKGRDVLANFHSRTGSWRFGLWSEVASAGNCLAVIDEAHMWFSARNWTKTQQHELAVFQQSRKEGLDLLWIAQHENRVDVAVREVTAFLWRCRRVGRFIVCRQTTPDDPKQVTGRKIFRIDPGLYQHYFTEERIGDRDGTGYGFGGGDAYRSDADAARRYGSGPQMGAGCRLLPNFFRVEFPDRVRWIGVNEPDWSSVVGVAVRAWSTLGVSKDPVELVGTFYRGHDGRLVEIAADGELVPALAELSLVGAGVALLSRAVKSVSATPSGLDRPETRRATAGGRVLGGAARGR